MFARLGWLALVALVAAAFWTGFGWLLGLPGLPWLFGVVLAVGFTAVHCVYWTDLRMRAPLVPVVALLAAAGAARADQAEGLRLHARGFAHPHGADGERCPGAHRFDGHRHAGSGAV